MDRERYAIVGYGFRMPGGIYTADDFWRLLSEPRITRWPTCTICSGNGACCSSR